MPRPSEQDIACCQSPEPTVVYMGWVRTMNQTKNRAIVYCRNCDTDLITLWWEKNDKK